RGIAGAIETAEVLGLAPEQLRFHANAARGLTPFLAREREIEQLWKCWGNASGGTGQLVEIIGDAGVGKSRLIWEFTQSPDFKNWRVLQASGLPYAAHTLYHPIGILLRQCFGIPSTDDPQTARSKVNKTLDQLGTQL